MKLMRVKMSSQREKRTDVIGAIIKQVLKGKKSLTDLSLYFGWAH